MLELAIILLPLAVLFFGPKIAVWKHRRRQRIAEIDIKRRQDKYLAECRRTGVYDY